MASSAALRSHHSDLSPPTSLLQHCNVTLFWWDRCSENRSEQKTHNPGKGMLLLYITGCLVGWLFWFGVCLFFFLNTCCLLHCLQHPGHCCLHHSCPLVSPDLLEPLNHTSVFSLAQHGPAQISHLSGSHKRDTMLKGNL